MKPKTQPKMTPTDLRRMAESMVAAGTMPSLETVLAAVASTRATYAPKILAARKEQET